jgi:hypothetical protein
MLRLKKKILQKKIGEKNGDIDSNYSYLGRQKMA